MRIVTTAALVAALAGPAAAEGMDHTAHAGGAMTEQMTMAAAPAPVSEPGQGAFAAIAEIVAALEADPETDWSKVNIAALRAHLVDMDLVTTQAVASAEPVEGGMRFTVSGTGEVAGAVRRMVTAHAAVMDGVGGWSLTPEPLADGAALTVLVPASDTEKLAGLGFFGVLAMGMHHPAHHWTMATGADPHS